MILNNTVRSCYRNNPLFKRNYVPVPPGHPENFFINNLQLLTKTMPPEPLVNPEEIDAENIQFDRNEIRKINRQRYEMEQLDAILSADTEEGICIGLKNVREDEFWVNGHIPGNPIMPGCLIIEAAAQLCSFYYGHQADEDDRFIGFGGLEEVSFRAPVKPNNNLILIAKTIEIRSRRMKFKSQALLSTKVVFEGTIIGMPLRT